jgi:hypothetical protein
MRYIFFTLVAVNIAYFIYGSYLQSDDVGSAARPEEFPEGVARIELLSESGGKDARGARISEAISNPVRDDEQTLEADKCNALGPFPDVFSGQAVVEQLAALDLSTEVRAVDRETGDSDYRVMIPPVNSLEEAFRKLRELKSRNIDSYVITDGEDALALSLGVFSTRESAEAAQTQRSREGYEVVVAEIPRLEREFWIFGQGKDVALRLESPLWESLKARQEGLVQQSIACPGSGSSD